MALGWWQFSRAMSGNGLSWVYTFEWPLFAVYAVYMWWRLVHDAAREASPGGEGAASGEGATLAGSSQAAPVSPSVAHQVDNLDFDPYDESDPELAAYNRYLASLHASDAASRRPAHS